jgi:hypothetical protein
MWIGIFIAVMLLGVLSFPREGFTCSVEKCRADQSYIEKDNIFCCFNPTGKEENLLSLQRPYSECKVNPGKNIMTLYDAFGVPTIYDTPVTYNCNPYNILVSKK